MNRVAIAFSTRDKTEQVKCVVEPLLQPDKFALFWSDGSKTQAGECFALGCSAAHQVTCNVRGGADTVIAFNLTQMLQHSSRYEFCGLVEDDVLLPSDWFDRTMALFEQGRQDGLEVGAVSARCYEDRILVQRDGYALMHNSGAGMVIFSRRAAELILDHFRTGWTMTNRRVFAQLTEQDIGAWWAFRGGQHALGADWHFDTVLAAHGLASLALTPSPVEMVGQDPPLAQQGLTIARAPVEARRDLAAYTRFLCATAAIRGGDMCVPLSRFRRDEDGGTTIFPHQIAQLGGWYEGDWRLRWYQGHGPFVWEALQEKAAGGVSAGGYAQVATTPCLHISVSGSCLLHASGGQAGGLVRIIDEASGFDNTIELPPEAAGNIVSMMVPAAVSYRRIHLSCLTPGVRFFGVTTREEQPWLPHVRFDHSVLPPVG